MGVLNRVSPLAGKWVAAASLVVLLVVSAAVYLARETSGVQEVGTRRPGNTTHEGGAVDLLDSAWLLVCTVLIFIMTPGVAFLYGGLAKHKNQVSTTMRGMVPMALVPLLWSLLGFSLAFGADAGHKGLIGSPASYGLMYNVGSQPAADLAPVAPGIPVVIFFTYQLQMAILTPALIIGSMSARANLNALCLFVCLWHLVVYCPIAHMVWHPEGLIGSWGVPDFAGGLVVHITSGFTALVCAWYLAPRDAASQVFDASVIAHIDGPEVIQGPANVPIVLLGTSLLFFGWFGFNAGNALEPGALAAQAILNSQLATATAVVAYLIVDYIRGKQMQATRLCFGGLVGLVCITPASGYVDVGASMLIGLIGAVFCSLAEVVMSQVKSVSDDLHVFAHHGVGGAVGLICTSLFATTSINSGGVNGAFSGNALVLAKAVLVLVLVVPWIMLATLGCLWLTDVILSLRVTDMDEMVGLDMAKHGENATAVGAAVAELQFGSRDGLNILRADTGRFAKEIC